MRIVVTSVPVDDQEKALRFYTEVLGVRFVQPSADMGPVKLPVLDDTCGNLIQLAERR